MSDETHLVLHPVRSDRTAEFERFLTDVVVPAVDARRPELARLLPAHYGEEEAERVVLEWVDTFAPLGTWAEAVVAAGQETNQALWTLEPVSLR